ncbi:hypothetical protein EVJ58_g7036, partial [Rhodofomes roseus]
MTTPYATPRYPRVPYSTPTSRSASRKVPRAPILNPYDQFPEPEFQSWIGDMTSAIRAALGREDPRERTARAPERVERDEETPEDSFAAVKARRAAKGKEREVQAGDVEQPIVIESDEEDDEEKEAEEAARALLYDEGEEFEQEDEEQPEEEESPEDEEGEEDSRPVVNAPEEAEEELDDESSEEEEEEPQPKAPAAEVIELLSDEEEEEDSPQHVRYEEEEEWEEDAEGSDEEQATTLAKLERQLQALREAGEDEIDEGEEEEDKDEKCDAVVEQPSSVVAVRPEVPYAGFVEENDIEPEATEDEGEKEFEHRVDLPDPWAGPSIYAEDFYSGGDFPLERGDAANPHVLPAEDEDDIVEVSGPTGEDQGVDSRGVSIAAEDAHEVQLPDPWSGPRLYAEDYYSGGDIRESDLRTRLPSPSHLMPTENELAEFLTPDVGTPETPALQAVEPDGDREAEHSKAFMDELYADLVDEDLEHMAHGAEVGPSAEGEAGDRPDSPELGSTDSPSPPKFMSHVDWNWPPAFPDGRMATRPGHLQSPELQDDSAEIVEISDDEAESHATPAAVHAELTEERPDVPASPDAEAGEESRAASEERPEESADIQLVDFVPEDSITLETSGATSDYPDQVSVDDLYADIDAYIASEEQRLAQDQSSRLQESDDALIRDFLASPSVDLGEQDATETTADDELQPESFVVPEEPADNVAESVKPTLGEELVVEDTSSDKRQESTAVTVEYEVEEPVTEGRRTEEPDINLRAPSIVAEELPDEEEGATLEAPIREYTVSEPDSHVETADATLELEDYDTSSVEAQNTGEPSGIIETTDTVEDETLDQTGVLPAPVNLAISDLHDRMLEPGVPMPVAADPTVPDPTSVAPSPGETSVATPAEIEAPQMDVSTSRDSSISGETSSRGRSPSGLFTPLTAENSRPATPKLRTSDLGDGHLESPLKNVVTADELAAADKVDTVSAAISDEIPESPKAAADSQPPELSAVTAERSRDVSPGWVDLQGPSPEWIDPQEPRGTAPTAELDELNLEYPSDTEEQSAISASAEEKQDDDVHVNLDTSLDADAEGDVDPDYVPEQYASTVDSNDAHVEAVDQPTAVTSTDNARKDETAVATDSSVEAKDNGETLPEGSQETAKTLVATQEVPADADDPFVVAGSAREPKDESPVQDDSQSAESSDARPLKRKREASRLPPRVTRAMSLKNPATVSVGAPPKPTAQRALKGKGRLATDEAAGDRDDTESPTNEQAEGSDSLIPSLSTAASRPTSRSSSVVSTALTFETSSAASPTINRTQTYPQTADLPRLIDAQEVMHHHHGRRVLQAAARMLTLGSRSTSQLLEPKPKSTAPSLSQSESRPQSPSPMRPESRPLSPSPALPPTRPTSLTPTPTPTPTSASDAGPSSVPPSATDAKPPTPPPVPVVHEPVSTTPPPRPAISGRLKPGNSPVTRSRCRFHKISLPREEDGPRIYFVVPGCALNDKELMEEEEIVDHGVPSFPQGTKLVADLEHLKLNPYVLGVLRQLVGVDLLREQEVFYLPQEGEEYAWKPKRHQHKHSVSKAKLSARGRKSIGAPIQSAPEYNGHAESISAAGAFSRAG